MEEYLLKVSKGAEREIATWLGLQESPPYVRLSTIAPLSNYGYPSGAESEVLRVNQHGLVTGVEGNGAVPHDFIPWQNVSYISDGTKLAEETKSKK